MTATVKAIYEQGVLRLKEPISLADGTHVEVIVVSRRQSAEEANPAEVLAAIASLPLEAPAGNFSGRHDCSVLCDKEQEL